MKLLYIFLVTGAITGYTFYEAQQPDAAEAETVYVQSGNTEEEYDDDPSETNRFSTVTVDSVVARAQRFKALLTAAQITTL